MKKQRYRYDKEKQKKIDKGNKETRIYFVVSWNWRDEDGESNLMELERFIYIVTLLITATRTLLVIWHC